MNDKYIIFYDYETTAIDAKVAEPVQLAAVAINPRTLTLVDEGQFNSHIRPSSFSSSTFHEDNKGNIEWHAKMKGCSEQDVLDMWGDAPSEDVVWKNFNNYLKKYHANPLRPTSYTAPIAAGFNIINYDNIISERLCQKYNTKYLFSKVHKIDLMDVLWMWFENKKDVTRLNFDEMRDYFGMSKASAHDALTDVTQGATLLIRFLNLVRKTSEKVKFKGAFDNENV